MAALGVARVIQGTTTIQSGNASVDVTLSPAVDKSKALRECRPIISDTWSPERAYITWEISSDGSKLTITRAGTPSVALPVKYSIVEFTAGVTVEELSFTTGASWGGQHDETISAVTLARTGVIPSYRVAESTTSPTTHYLARFELTSGTNLRVTSKDSTLALSCIVQLLKFDSDSGVTVQQVTEALEQFAATADVTISAVDLAHTLVSGSSESTAAIAQDTSICGWTTLTASTTLRHQRRNAAAAGTWTVTSWVMDFGGGAAQRGVATQSSHSNATVTQAISTVDLNSSTVHIGMGPWPACHSGANNASWQDRLFYAELTSTTQITFTRGTTATTLTGQSWQVMDWSALMAGGDAEVTPNDATHGHSADQVALSQVHGLIIGSAGHGHAADQVTLAQLHALAIADALHSHAADPVTLAQQSQILIADGLHGHSAEEVTFLQAHLLQIAQASHGHTADPVTLMQVHDLGVSDGVHGHFADEAGLISAGVLSIADGAHGHVADALTLIQVHDLGIDDAAHGHAADNISLDISAFVIIAPATHGHAAAEVTLVQVHDLGVEDAVHSHQVDAVALAQVHALGIADATHAHAAEEAGLSSAGTLSIASAIHGHLAGSLGLAQVHALGVSAARHDHLADVVTLGQIHGLAIEGAVHGHLADVITVLESIYVLVPDNAFYRTAKETIFYKAPAI